MWIKSAASVCRLQPARGGRLHPERGGRLPVRRGDQCVFRLKLEARDSFVWRRSVWQATDRSRRMTA